MCREGNLEPHGSFHRVVSDRPPNVAVVRCEDCGHTVIQDSNVELERSVIQRSSHRSAMARAGLSAPNAVIPPVLQKG